MKPALFLYPHISAYPVFLLAGFFFGWVLARRRAGWFGIRKNHLDNLALLLPLTGLFGARLFARLFYAEVPFWDALKVWEGSGLVFYGGFIFSAAAVLGYAIWRRIRLVALLDCLAPSAALGLAFGRIGCFMAGCCWGDACVSAGPGLIADQAAREQMRTIPAISTPSWPLAVTFPAGSDAWKQHLKHGLITDGSTRSAAVHPVQLYESVLAFALCILLHLGTKRARRPGDITIALLLGYAFIRFCTEFLRADNPLAYAGFTFSQTVSIGIAACAILCLALRRFKTSPSAPGAAAPYKPRPAIG